jgi:uncharacterized protein YyaL (SSP411 family)
MKRHYPHASGCIGILLFFIAAIADVHAAKTADTADSRRANRLIHSNSPYLLQHAYNPVDWYPWGEAALEKARQQNKPVFLSIGYSTCHWCHVMAKESCEDEKIAAYLNRHFISIKIDREQHPALDAIYLEAARQVNGYAGWPLSVFIDHQLRPFHAGVYYPPYSTQNHLGFYELLVEINRLWQQQRDKVAGNAVRLSQRVADAMDETGDPVELEPDLASRAIKEIGELFDDVDGGFGDAPKFFAPGIHKLLLSSGQQNAIDMSRQTLDAMIYGGVYDQLGGGFHRYAVDSEWKLPHFEKMLYSQAQVVDVLLDHVALNADPLYSAVIVQTLDFAITTMKLPSGGFASAVNAGNASADSIDTDTESGEGRYYLWTADEIASVLAGKFDDKLLALFNRVYSIEAQGNIMDDPAQTFHGKNILFVAPEYRRHNAKQFYALTDAQQAALQDARTQLLLARDARPPPERDKKIISAWNAMMLLALARASGLPGQAHYLDQALSLYRFMRQRLYHADDNVLYREIAVDGTLVQGQVSAKAVLEDYAWMIRALLALYAVKPEPAVLDWAIALQQKQDALLLDSDTGAYFAFQDTEQLFRARTITDTREPALNAIVYQNLLQLARLRPEQAGYQQKARRLLSAFSSTINASPVETASIVAVLNRAWAQHRNR